MIDPFARRMAKARPEPADERRGRPVGYFDLLEDLPRNGCAVCRGGSRTAWRYLDGLLWEGITDPGVRSITRAAHGFCRQHSMLAISVASQASGQLGMAILFEDLLRHVEGEATSASGRRRPRWWTRDVATDTLHPHEACRACVSAHSTERNYLAVLADAEPSSEIGTLARDHAPSLCLNHLRMGLRFEDGEASRAGLVDVFMTGAEALRGQLLGFMRKRDYRYAAEEMSEEEATAWVRAVHALVGAPDPRVSDR